MTIAEMLAERDNLYPRLSTFYQAFLEQAQRRPEAPAIACAGGTRVTTYGELRALAERHALGIAVGAPPGVPVLLFASKGADSVACMLGCLASGRPFAWLHKRLRGPQIADVIAASGAQCMVVDESGLLALRSAVQVDGRLSEVRWLALSDVPASSDRGATLAGIAGDQLGCCLFTSGSTGRQRGVMVAEGDLTVRARSEAHWFSLSAGDRLLSILPLSFDVGLNQLMSGLLAGACVVIQDSWLPKDLLDSVARDQITGISGVPAIWRDLMAFVPALAGSLRYLTISGGSLSSGEQERLLAAAPGVQVFKTYGQTETFRSSSLRPDEFAGREASVGRAYPGTRVTVVRDDGTECPTGEVGEIVHVGDGTMLGYLGAALLDDRVGKRVYTGDNGYLDRDGYLYLKGRRDSMVKIAGNRIYPDEVAGQLRALDGVDEAEVIAVSGASGDPRLIGFAVLARRAEWTAEGIRLALTRRLPSHMVPAEVVLLPAIPRLPNGKPDRPILTTLLP